MDWVTILFLWDHPSVSRSTCDALHNTIFITTLSYHYAKKLSSDNLQLLEGGTETSRPQETQTRERKARMSKIGRYNEVAEFQGKGTLTICRIKDHGGDEVRGGHSFKATKAGGQKEATKGEACACKIFRSRRRAIESIVSMFHGLDQAGDAFFGSDMNQMVVNCADCRGWHVSASSLTDLKVADAA